MRCLEDDIVYRGYIYVVRRDPCQWIPQHFTAVCFVFKRGPKICSVENVDGI
jgi:hypothetical protein